MHGGDVDRFHRFARPYDLVMPAADRAVLDSGLALAERPLVRGLDVGGGTGRAVRALPGIDWTVVDAAAGMLGVARERGLAVLRADAARLPVSTGSVDAVTIVDALHHFGDPTGAIAEAARVLAPGGVLVVREFDPTTLRGRALVAAERLVGFDSQFWPPGRLAERLAGAGLEPAITEEGFGYTVAGVHPGADRTA